MRHRSWARHALGMVACAVVYMVAGVTAGTASSNGIVLLAGLFVLASVLGFVWFAILVGLNLWRMWRVHENAVGRFTKAERAVVAKQDEAQSYWHGAKQLSRMLAAGETPPARQVWGVVLQPGEQFVIDAPADYARYYGTVGTYQHTSGFFFGSVPFMAAAYGVTAMANSSRRKAAEAAAQTQWREIQTARVIVTNRRALCQRADGRWLSFWYAGATAVYPEPENWNVVFDFPDTEPLLLHGPAAPYVCVMAVNALHGVHGLANHPGLERLRP